MSVSDFNGFWVYPNLEGKAIPDGFKRAHLNVFVKDDGEAFFSAMITAASEISVMHAAAFDGAAVVINDDDVCFFSSAWLKKEYPESAKRIDHVMGVIKRSPAWLRAKRAAEGEAGA